MNNKLEYLDMEGSYVNSTKDVVIILTDFPNTIKKMFDKISFHEHFKEVYFCQN